MPSRARCWGRRCICRRRPGSFAGARGCRPPARGPEPGGGWRGRGGSAGTRCPGMSEAPRHAAPPDRRAAGGRLGALAAVPDVEDVAAALEPGVGEVSRVRLGLARQEGILGDVDGDVLGWHQDDGGPCSVEREGMARGGGGGAARGRPQPVPTATALRGRREQQLLPCTSTRVVWVTVPSSLDAWQV